MFGRRSTSTTRSTATSRTTGSVADPMSPTGAKGNWKAKLNPKRLSPNQSNPALRVSCNQTAIRRHAFLRANIGLLLQAKVNDPTITSAEATEAQQVLRERVCLRYTV